MLNKKIGLCFIITLLSTSKAFSNENQVEQSFIHFYKTNYILPYYRTTSVNRQALRSVAPSPVKREEFKGQLSVKVPLFESVFHDDLKLYGAYTQLSYWQAYTKSPYFRETNYEPEIHLSYEPSHGNRLAVGINHESNGQGGALERSWNRLFIDGSTRLDHFTFSVRAWLPVFKSDSIDLHNPDIAHFLGYEEVKVGWTSGRFNVILSATNIESVFKRGHQKFEIGFKLKEYLHLYGQLFRGYGQNLIDYNHKTTAFGIGLSFNPPK